MHSDNHKMLKIYDEEDLNLRPLQYCREKNASKPKANYEPNCLIYKKTLLGLLYSCYVGVMINSSRRMQVRVN